MNFSPPGSHLRLVTKLDTVIIGVCTYRRPKMLANCLKSLSNQKSLDDYFVQIVVIDNDLEPSAKTVVEEADKVSRFPISYVHHPIRGIPQARNAVLEFARLHAASWLVYIDDDETAGLNCVANLLDPKFKCVPIVYGDTIENPGGVQPRWKLDRRRTLSDPTMSNVRFDSRVIQSGIEFDETLSLTGGEDEAFFAEAIKRRFRIAKTNKATTFAELHLDRFTLRRQVGKAFSEAALRQRGVNMAASPFGAICKGAMSAAAFLAMGFVSAAVGIMYLAEIVIPSRKFIGVRTSILSSGHCFAEAAGHIAALFGRLPEPYRTVDGH